GAKGESSPEFTAGGDLLFLAVRPTAEDDTPPQTLWCLPRAGGEAHEVAVLPGGVDGVVSAGGTTVIASSMLPSAAGVDEDETLRAVRKDNKVSAVLHAGYPVRYWDHDLGPAQEHLFSVGDAPPADLTPAPGDGLRDAHFDVSRDGTFIIT
ncbi:S9 family peptidase, partial [Mycobacterium sp. ITM-2017-0098]